MRTKLELRKGRWEASLGNLIFAILQLSINLVRSYPRVAIPTILLASGAVYFDLLSKGEVAIAFSVFMVLLFFWAIGLGVISKVRKKDFTRKTSEIALATTFVFSLFLSGFFISEIRSMPTHEQRIAEAQKRRENDFLKNYTPNGVISFIASTTEMTDYGKRLFFLNDPKLVSTENELNSICKTNASHIDASTLGCFSQRNNTIYLLDNNSGLSDNLLATTASHELLHSVYVNMPFEEKRRIDAALLEVWNGPSNEYLAKRLSAYNFPEESPNLNELHSIIGTEIEKLPPVLEEHYSKYFNQPKVSKISSSYNKKVEGKKTALAKITKNLNALKKKIESNKKQISRLVADLDKYKRDMNLYKSLSNSSNYYISKYNELVPVFNETVSKINDLESETQDFISEYNSTVPDLNNKVKDLKRFGSTEKS